MPRRRGRGLTQDQQRVFKAYRTVFRGENAKIRKRKKIRSLIETQNEPCAVLCQDLGVESIVLDLQTLLQRRIFEQDFDEHLTFTDSASNPLVDTRMGNLFGAGDIKREARKPTLRSATTKGPSRQLQEEKLTRGMCAHGP